MKTKFKFNRLFIMLFALSLAIVSCGEDAERTNVQVLPGQGTDNVFRGLPTQGITVGLVSGSKLRLDAGGERPMTFSMTIAPNSQFVMINGVKFVPSYWTYPAHPGALDFFAVSENEYSRGDASNPFGGDGAVWGPWDRQRFAGEGHGTVREYNGRYIFQGEIVLYTMQAPTDFSFDTGTFGVRFSFGGTQPPQRIGTIR